MEDEIPIEDKEPEKELVNDTAATDEDKESIAKDTKDFTDAVDSGKAKATKKETVDSTPETSLEDTEQSITVGVDESDDDDDDDDVEATNGVPPSNGDKTLVESDGIQKAKDTTNESNEEKTGESQSPAGASYILEGCFATLSPAHLLTFFPTFPTDNQAHDTSFESYPKVGRTANLSYPLPKNFAERMMNALEAGIASDAISWIGDGQAIALKTKILKESSYLTTYFKAKDYSGFIRNCNRWYVFDLLACWLAFV